jgi:dipeptidyl aminopeptidase/acylaminoacyl peptidase
VIRLSLALLALTLVVSADERRPATIADAISMVRIQFDVTADDRVAAVSPDGSRIAFVVWRGDLERNVNVYSLCVLNPEASGPPARMEDLTCPVTTDFGGDSKDEYASPIAHVRFVANGSALAFLGRFDGRPAQVYTVDIASRRLTQLTHHPTDVRSFVADEGGRLRFFSAVSEDEGDAARVRDAEVEGVFLFDLAANPDRLRYRTAVTAADPLHARRIRRYFWVPPGPGAEPLVIFDSRQTRVRSDSQQAVREPAITIDTDRVLENVSSLTIQPSGHYALFYPYARADHDMQPESYGVLRDANAFAQRLAQPFAIVDLTRGTIAPLLDAPHLPFDWASGSPVWSPDGGFVLVYTLSSSQREEPARWSEVNLTTKASLPVPIPDGWRAVSWTNDGVLATRGNAVGRLRKAADGWSSFDKVGETSGFTGMYRGAYQVAVTGRRVVGIQQGVEMPPELSAYDVTSRATIPLTDLNPALKQLRLGTVEDISWTYKRPNDSSGLLVKPIDYQPDRRYPLVVQFDDGVLGPAGQPYLLDSPVQLSGLPTQMLAAEGMVVLYMRTPAALRSAMETPAEPELARGHLEAGIAHLDRLGLIDPNRVGITGWSRAAYHVVWITMRSPFPYAAASMIDGGQSEHLEDFRPFWDGELARIRTPLLLQAHGPRTLTGTGRLADHLDALGKSVEMLYFATAPHLTTTPRHRRRSLEAHLDWWRFWLQDRRDDNVAKNAQYERWDAMRRRRP